MIRQGEVYWVDLDSPVGSGQGYSRPALVVQGDLFNESGIKTIVVCLLTSNPQRARFAGHVAIPALKSGLERDSVAVPTQLYSLDTGQLRSRSGRISRSRLTTVMEGIALVLRMEAPGP